MSTLWLVDDLPVYDPADNKLIACTTCPCYGCACKSWPPASWPCGGLYQLYRITQTLQSPQDGSYILWGQYFRAESYTGVSCASAPANFQFAEELRIHPSIASFALEALADHPRWGNYICTWKNEYYQISPETYYYPFQRRLIITEAYQDNGEWKYRRVAGDWINTTGGVTMNLQSNGPYQRWYISIYFYNSPDQTGPSWIMYGPSTKYPAGEASVSQNSWLWTQCTDYLVDGKYCVDYEYSPDPPYDFIDCNEWENYTASGYDYWIAQFNLQTITGLEL